MTGPSTSSTSALHAEAAGASSPPVPSGAGGASGFFAEGAIADGDGLAKEAALVEAACEAAGVPGPTERCADG
jgi:hypothetical protein